MSTFTDADHAKAVELYRKFGASDWWPRGIDESGGFWHLYSEPTVKDIALSAIAWAMVAHLYTNGGCELAPEDPFGKGPVCYAYDNNAQGTPHYGATPFLALAAAVEAQ